MEKNYINFFFPAFDNKKLCNAVKYLNINYKFKLTKK